VAISLASKTEVALSSPTTVTNPSGSSAGDLLLLIACQNTSSAITIGTADNSKWWTRWVRSGSGASSIMIAVSRFATGQTSPVLTSTATGSACLYRYTGVAGPVDVTINAATNTNGQTMPYMSGVSGQEIVWIAAGYRGSTPAPTLSMSRGTTETTQTSSFTTLQTYRESLSGSVTDVTNTLTVTNSTSTAQTAAVLLADSGVAWVYKGRDDSASDSTGAA
jgi:hypothetical protein